MVLMGRVRRNHGRPKGMMLVQDVGRFWGKIDEFGVNKRYCFLVGHCFGVEIEDSHEMRYLVLVHSPVCC